MKIGVLTYHCVPNFGAQLQATSTVGYIRRMGHEAVMLHWYPKDLEDMYAKRIPKEQIEAHNAYTKNALPITEFCRTEKDLLQAIENNQLDGIIVGSDALFKYIPVKLQRRFSKRKLRYIHKNVLSVEKLDKNPFFGGFVKSLKKEIPVYAFSVSSQNCSFFEMNKKEKLEMKSSMSHFAAITVRDEWTKDMVENILGVTGIQITPDPVFSFNQNCYLKMPSKEEIIKKYQLTDSYVLLSFSVYFTSESYINQLGQEAKKQGYLPVAFPMPESLRAAKIEKQIQLPLDPLEWYALIKYSSGYIGERMHPIVVCLHNVVPFFAFDEYGTYQKRFWGMINEFLQSSSKTYRILERAGLTEWMYSYKAGKQLPSPDTVIKHIENFDRIKCNSFSCSYQALYEQSMNEILSH